MLLQSLHPLQLTTITSNAAISYTTITLTIIAICISFGTIYNFIPITITTIIATATTISAVTMDISTTNITAINTTNCNFCQTYCY